MKRRLLVSRIREMCQVSERRACRTLNIHRSTFRYQSRRKPDEDALRTAIIELTRDYGSYGYRMVTAKLQQQGWRVNHKRDARIWWEEGLKIPKKQRKRRHLWLRDGSIIRLRPVHQNHVWSYDIVADRLANEKRFRMLTVIDEYTRESLAILVGKKLGWEDVVSA